MATRHVYFLSRITLLLTQAAQQTQPTAPTPGVTPATAVGSQGISGNVAGPAFIAGAALTPVPQNPLASLSPQEIADLNAQVVQLLNSSNPALQSALIQVVLQARGSATGTVTMEDVGAFLTSQGRNTGSRHSHQDYPPRK